MKKYIKLLMVFCLSISLFACTETKENVDTQNKFEEYLNQLFKEEIEADFLNFHFALLNPEKEGFEKPEVTLGELTLESEKEGIEDAKEELKKLYEFNKLELTKEQQKIYRLLEIQLEYSIEYENYLDFNFVFGENKVNDNLITNMTEYRIQTIEDVEDYIVLLNDVDRYISEGIEMTKQMAEEGNIQLEIEKEAVIEQCQNFLAGKEIENYFHRAILNVEEISEAQQADYENQVAEAVETSVRVAYEKIIDLYENLPVADSQGSLMEKENGKEYFEYLLKVRVGKERKPEEWIQILEEEIDSTIRQWINVMFTSSTLEDELENVEMPADNAQDLVDYLAGCIEEDFPKIEQVDYEVSYLDDSVANNLISAYYVIPPLDAPDLNVIKVNPVNDDLVDLFSTLAHEGFPGHLYQNNYSVQSNQSYIYYFLDNLGSSEGWAEYVGMNAYYIGDIGSDDFKEYMRLYSYVNRLLGEYIGFRVNYSGWKTEDIADYLNSVGLMSDIAEELYEDSLLRPAVYSPYSLGTYEVLALREKAEEALGDKFDALSFHKALLDVGTVHFEIIEEAIDAYIAENK